MRSRYTAYVLGDVDYLKTTWHADYRLHDLSLDAGLRWLGLEVIAAPAPVGDQASVEFEARLLVGAQVNALHEHSRFTRVDGQWLYTNGEALEPTFKPWKPGRNEACPCGSGLKFKRCCGR
jgi:SEC-C motif-containing protein